MTEARATDITHAISQTDAPWADARARAQALWAALAEEDFEAAGESVHALRGIIRRRFSGDDLDIEARLETLSGPAARAGTGAPSEPNPLLLARWAQVRRLAREAWPQLDAADFERADGSTERLRGIIRGRFGGTDASIMGVLARWSREPLAHPDEPNDRLQPPAPGPTGATTVTGAPALARRSTDRAP